MTKAEQGPFAILMASGQYYVEKSPTGIITHPDIQRAEHFSTRWAALMACNQGREFANSSIRVVPPNPEIEAQKR